MQRFSANESGYKLCVQVPSVYESSAEQENSSMLFGKVKLLHSGHNRNNSNVTDKALKNCMSTIKYKPVLANFCEIDGVKDFTSHDMEITEDGVEYYERQVGCFTSEAPYIEYDEETEKNFLYANVAIPREYTAAAEIIESKGGTKVSVELFVNEMSYDSQAKELILDDIEVMGVTLLGKNPETGEDVQEGMKGARLDIADFSAENNSVKYEQNDRLIELLEDLTSKISNFNIKDSKKGGYNEVKFEELLKQYNKTVEDIQFEYDGLSDDELELAFKEAFEDESDGSDEVDEPEESAEDPANEPAATALEEDDEDDEDEDEDLPPKKKTDYSVTFNGETKEFSVSLGDIIYSLQQLVNETYSEADNDWYCVDVYDAEKTVVMHGWQKSYRQSYKCKKDTFSLVGDRVEVFAQYLTADEIQKLDDMRQNYAAISEKLSKYEAEPEKMEILNSKDYEAVSETADFTELAQNHFDMSVEDVRAKADEILLAYAKVGGLNFAAKDESANKVGSKTIFGRKTNAGRYGKIFSK